MIQYRPDIDGLRAIAVLSVLMAHFGFAGFSGGFVGVDIFFVISGFLITSILVKDADAGRPILGAFYLRRIRRIYPALILVVFATLIAGAVILWPIDYAELSFSAVLALFGAANLFFYTHTGYFDGEAALKPLLHMWSLGVEEQFYLVWPAAFWFLFRQGRRSLIAPCLCLVIAVSLSLAVYDVAQNPPAAFYLPHDRAWELALGALLVFLPVPTRQRRASTAIGVAGLALIAGSVVLLSDATPFPGLTAIPATVGTALLIWHATTAPTPVSRGLGSRLPAFIGLISYSLYLWHWPILVFYRHLSAQTVPDVASAFAMLALSIALATLSWRFVETPFRRGGSGFAKLSWTGVPTIAAALALALLAGGALLWASRATLDNAANRMAAFKFDPAASYRTGICHLFPQQTEADFKVDDCLPATGTNAVVLWGDSSVVQFYPGLRAALAKQALNVGVISLASCPPVLGFDPPNVPHCSAFNDFALEQIKRLKPDFVVIGGLWQTVPALPERLTDIISRLEASGTKVFVFGAAASFLQRVPVILAKRLRRFDTRTLADPGDLLPGLQITDANVAAIVGQSGKAAFLSTFALTCPDGQCRLTTADGLPAYFDSFHLTEAGSLMAAERIVPVLPLR